jgi:small-conductance mechanosensitive channel
MELLLQDWRGGLWGAGVVLVSIAAGLGLHAIFFALLKRQAGKPGRVIGPSLARHGRRPAQWFFPLAVLLLVVPLTRLPRPVARPLEHLLGLGMIISAAWAVILMTEVLADVLASRYRVDVADNLSARRIQTQVMVLRRITTVVVVIVAAAAMLLSIPAVRSIGASLLASAGLAGLVAGVAMKSTLGNLIAGIQIGLTQPIRLDDAVIVEGQWGWIEEINATYVVVRIWNWQRMILPLTYFIEQPFQNWTRTTANLIGSVHVYADYTLPVEEVRKELERIVRATDKWNGKVCVLQVTHATPSTIELRALADARDAGTAWDLRCYIRERLITFLQDRYPHCLPKTRAELQTGPAAAPSA